MKICRWRLRESHFSLEKFNLRLNLNNRILLFLLFLQWNGRKLCKKFGRKLNKLTTWHCCQCFFNDNRKISFKVYLVIVSWKSALKSMENVNMYIHASMKPDFRPYFMHEMRFDRRTIQIKPAEPCESKNPLADN